VAGGAATFYTASTAKVNLTQIRPLGVVE